MCRITPIALVLIVAIGCVDQGPTMFSLAGEYEATAFTSNDGTQVIDHLAANDTITITLTANGATTGLLVVHGGAADGGTLRADLQGAWTLVDDVVNLSHTADTFLRDMPFLVSDRQLIGEEVFDGVRVRVVLTRQAITSIDQ